MPTKKKKSGLRRRSRRRKQKRILFLSGLSLACVLIAVGLIYAWQYRYVNKTDKDTIASHIYIGQADVSGMKAAQAEEAVKKQLEEYGKLTLTMTVGEKTADASLLELGFSMKNLKQAVSDAVSYGKEGSVWKRFRVIRKLEKEKKMIEEQFVLDGEKAAAVIEERAANLESHAVNASIRRVSGGFEITDESEGRTIDAEKSVKEMEKCLNNHWDYQNISLTLTDKVEEPKIRRADLESIQDELGSYATDAGEGERVKNLKRAAEMINGSILMPGEEFSVVEATTPYTKENGYVDGSAYENGQVVQNIGGGLCQVSTTLYNAVLYSELKVTERSAHSMIVTYVDPSRDAAIAEGVKDLKFVNNYESPIFLEGYIDGNNQLRFHIYGRETRPKSRSVEYESETLERKEYTKKFVEEAGQPIGYMEREGIGFNGRTARLWKVVCENGREISRDVINNSTYKASEVKVKIGVASDNAEAVKIMKNAIASQDEEQIKAAISQAKAKEKAPAESTEENTGE